MHKFVYAALFAGTLSACANTPVGDITACSEALFAANTSNPVALLSVALSTPTCVALGTSVIQDIISRVSVEQKARGVRE